MGTSLTGASSITNDQLDSIHHKISIPPKILCPSTGKPSCCIFRVPSSFVETNGHAYHPHIVSLGPYHLGHPDLSMIQEHKYRYLGAVLSRCPLSLEYLIRSFEPLIGPAIKCYSESISLSTDEFLEMLLVDSVFLIELFMRFGRLVPGREDPIFTMSWVLPFFCRDFLCLKNQIPYFFLEKIYNEVTSTADKFVPLWVIPKKAFKGLIWRITVIANPSPTTGQPKLNRFVIECSTARKT